MRTATFPALLQRFFTDRLCVQMEASRHTIASYRDTFRLLIRYAGARSGKAPTKLEVGDIDADMVANFLIHVEGSRGNAVRSRNARLAAIRSFFRYVAMTEPVFLHHCQRILAMPNKRQERRAVTFLDADEIAALLGSPDRATWVGRRDHALLLLALQTGLRASELVNLNCNDVVIGTGAHVKCLGKGRKDRRTPLRRDTTRLIAVWIRDRKDSEGPLRGTRLKRTHQKQRLLPDRKRTRKSVHGSCPMTAQGVCPSLFKALGPQAHAR